MITDDLLKVSSTQTITSSAVSTNTIDLGVARDIGEGENLYMYFNITTAVTRAAGAATVEFQVIGSASADLSSATVLGSSGAIAKASLTAGTKIFVKINPQDASTALRYIGGNYVVSATCDTGAATAGIVHGIQDGKKFYTSGFSVT